MSTWEDTMLDLMERAQGLLEPAGIRLGSDMHVHDERVYGRVFREGLLGLGESYMEGWWDSESIDDLVTKAVRAGLDSAIESPWREFLQDMRHTINNFQSYARSFIVGERHYDLGNKFYASWLDTPHMVYTCADWSRANTLEMAQRDKLDFICKTIGVENGDRVLDIGCGWGGFAHYAAKVYGASVTGITISKQQAAYAYRYCEGLPVRIRIQDYRDLEEQFDHIVSVEMIEAVGYKNLAEYMEIVRRSLKPGGKFYLQAIVGERSARRTDEWTDRYIFPNGMLPSMTQLLKAAEGRLKLVGVQEVGEYYDRTLMEWNLRFQQAWPEIADTCNELFERMWPSMAKKCSNGFKRMWEYYLLSCAGSFRAGKNRLYRLVFVHDNDTLHAF